MCFWRFDVSTIPLFLDTYKITSVCHYHAKYCPWEKRVFSTAGEEYSFKFAIGSCFPFYLVFFFLPVTNIFDMWNYRQTVLWTAGGSFSVEFITHSADEICLFSSTLKCIRCIQNESCVQSWYDIIVTWSSPTM